MNKIKSFLNKPAVTITLRSLAAVVLVCAIVFASVFGSLAVARKNRLNSIINVTTSAATKNVILMIGDGMGPNHLEVTKAYYGLDSLYMESLSEMRGTVATFSRNADITDSAAAATALSCGIKTDNGKIAYYDGQNLQNMSEYAASLGKISGIVATETLTGATPSAFSAHNSSRNSTDEIAESQLSGDVSVFLGAGKSYFDGKQQSITENGFTYVTDTSLLNDSLYDDEKVFASFDKVAPYGESSGGTIGNLTEMSLFAANYLDANDDSGFFLMIEGSYIDKKSHSNDLNAMVKELRAFDEAVKAMVNWATAKGDTAVIVTADHETGGLTYNSESAAELNDDMYTSFIHSATDVYWFVYCISVPELTDGRRIDNTDISVICRLLMQNAYNASIST